MLLAGVTSPLSHAASFFARERRLILVMAACILVAGLNMIAFMWIKPLLNYMVPFWADPMLAAIDHSLFLGHDPWALFTWLNSTPAAIFYHRGWFALMILTLVIVAKAPPSADKSAVMLSYFFLWSVIGPLIHSLIPAAGPVFFAQMGYGDRFGELRGVPETRQAANYLWVIYAGERFGPGSGISAMPSMHVATTAWMVICVQIFARRWLTAMAAVGILIFLLSISLGWHYAVDGIVGGASALLCHRAVRAFYRRRSSAVPTPSLVTGSA